MSDNTNKNTTIPILPLNKAHQRLYAGSSDSTFEHETYKAMEAYLNNKTAYIGQLLYCKERDQHYKIAKGENNKMVLKEIGIAMIADNISYNNSSLSNVNNVKTALDSTINSSKQNKSSIDTLNGQVDTLNTQVGGINTNIGTITSNVSNISSNLDIAKSDIRTAKSDIVTAKSDINRIQTEATGTKSQVTKIEEVLVQKFPVTYTAPTLTVTSSNLKYELGETINPTIKVNFAPNDAGAVTKYKVFKGEEVVKEDNNIVSDYAGTESFKLTGNITYKAEVSYAEGAIKLDILGRQHSQGRIPANTISKTIDIIAARASWGCVFDSAATPTIDAIRGKDVTSIGLTAGSTIRAVATATTKTVVFAYPADLKECSKIRYEEINDDHNESEFKCIELDIPDKSRENATKYRVYYYTALVPFGSTATFTLTI